MKLAELKQGRVVEIMINREGYRYHLNSKIEEVQKTTIFISLISSGSRIFQFRESDEIEFVCRQDDRLWEFKGVRGGVTKRDGQPCHYLTTFKDGMSFNRRNAYRVPVKEESKYFYYNLKPDVTEEQVIKEDLCIEDSSLYDRVECSCFIKDLSETGIGFFTKEKLSMGRELIFYITSQHGILKCKGKVIRESKESLLLYPHFYGCVFTESDQKLTKHIFEIQRAYLKKIKK